VSASRKVVTLVLVTALLTPTFYVDGQTTKVYRIGYVSGRSGAGLWDDIFKTALRERGFVEGENIIIAYRWAEGKLDRLPALVMELVNLNVDIIVTETTPAARIAKNSTKTIPIVMALSADAVGAGLVESLARPGANITGLTFIGPDLAGKLVELLKEISPKISRLAYLGHPELPPEMFAAKATEAAAQRLNISFTFLEARTEKDLKRGFVEIEQARADGLVVSQNVMYLQHRKIIADLARRHRIPAIYGRSDFVDAGGLASYATSFPDLYRRAAVYVDKILKGAKPADLPVEQPTKFELVINLKAAKQIGLIIPPNVLARADRVIR
jgi:putative ABC transport system substrate-binding protein